MNLNCRITPIVLALVFATQLGFGFNESDSQDVEILFLQKIPTRDGIALSAAIYKPADQNEALPAIMTLTPYTADDYHDKGMFFARNGYVLVTVDVRGRGDSEGTYEPWVPDGKDGYDAVEWIASQPWCNGQVGMMGGSYRGMTQWLTHKELPPSLKTIIPTASAAPGLDFPKYNGIFYSYITQWLAFTSGNIGNNNVFRSDHWVKVKFAKMYEEHIPFSQLDSLTGIDGRAFQTWIQHPAFDDFWKSILPSKNEYKKMNIPVLTITGHYDSDQVGALHYYDQYMTYASDKAKSSHFLLMGPWTHSGTRRPTVKVGPFEFGENSVVDILQLHREWFDWILKDGEKPSLLKDRVTYYVMGENKWKYANTIEAISNDNLTFYLTSPDGDANDPFHAGYLIDQPPGKEPPDQVVYDPLENSGEDRDERLKEVPYHAFLQTLLHDKDGLYYFSAPLEEEVELSGKIEFTAYIEINTPDTDFEFSIYEITEKNEVIWLANDLIRARYRKSLEKEELVTPGKVEKYVFDGNYLTSRTIGKGSRLRLDFGYVDAPNMQKNYNSGKDVSYETADDARTVTIKLHHSKNYLSAIRLPIKRY